MQAPETAEPRRDGAKKSPTSPPNAAASAAEGNKQAGLKKPQQQHKRKKGKHGDDNKQGGAVEALKSPQVSAKAVVRVRSPKSTDRIPIERDHKSPDQASPEQDGKQANNPAAAETATKPSALGRMARRISLSMPSRKKQAPSNAAKQGKPVVEAATAVETSEVWVPSSEMPGDSPNSRRKSSVRFGATTLQSITPYSLSKTLSSEHYQCWRALVIVGIIMVTSFTIAVAVYVLRPRKSAMKHCASVECKLALDNLKSLLDPQIKPCDDLHQHVCGRSGDKTFGGAALTARAHDDLLVFAQRLLLNRNNKDIMKHPGVVQLATTFSACYAFATSPNSLDEAPLAEAIANDTDILSVTDVASTLQRVVRLSLLRGISTLFKTDVVTYVGDVALYVSRGKSLSEKLAKRHDGTSLQQSVSQLFKVAFVNTRTVRQLDADATVRRLLEFDNSVQPESRYANEEEMTGNSKDEFMTQYIGGPDWLGFVNSLLPVHSSLKETSLVLVSEADMIRKPVNELRKDTHLAAIYILLHVVTEIGRFYGIPLSRVTKACLQMAQEVLPPALSNVFNNVTASAASDPSRAGAVFFRVRKVFAKHPLKQGMSDEDKKSVVSFLTSLSLHVHRTALGIWPNGSGWRPDESAKASDVVYPRFHVILKVREALRRLMDPPSLEHIAFARDLLAKDAAYSQPLNEVFLPPSLRRAPVLYSGEVPVEFDMGTVGFLLAVQMVHATGPSQNASQEWHDKNIGAFGRCVKQLKATAIASQIDTLPANRLRELFDRTYSLRVVHGAVSSYYDEYRDTSNFKVVWKEAQRILFRRFCLLSCGDSGRVNGTDGSSPLDCLVPALSMPEFYEAFDCEGIKADSTANCANLS